MSLQECWSYKVHDHCSRKLKKACVGTFGLLYCIAKGNKTKDGRSHRKVSVLSKCFYFTTFYQLHAILHI